jgi:hypothetical protein
VVESSDELASPPPAVFLRARALADEGEARAVAGSCRLTSIIGRREAGSPLLSAS